MNADRYKKTAGSVADTMQLAAATVKGKSIGNNGDHPVSLYEMPQGTTLQRLEQAIATRGWGRHC